METFSPLLTDCAGNSPVTGEFPTQRPVTRNFDVFFDLRLNKQLSKQSWGWWFEMPSRSFWRHCNVSVQFNFMNGNLYCGGSLHMHFLLIIYSLLSHIYVWTKVTHLKRSTTCILYLRDVKCLYVILCPISGREQSPLCKCHWPMAPQYMLRIGMSWKHFPHNWSFVWGPVDSPHNWAVMQNFAVCFAVNMNKM